MQKVFRNIFFVLVALSVTAAFWVSKEFLFPFVTTKAFFFRICIELALPFYVYFLVSDKKLRPNLRNPLSLAVLAFLAVNVASAFFGASVVRSFWGNFERMGGVFYLGHLAALYFYVLAMGQMPGDYIRKFLKVMLLVAAVITLNGIFGWLNLPTLVADPSLPARVSSTLGNPIYLGSYLIIPLFLALFFTFQAKNKLDKAVYYFLALAFAWGIFLSNTRGALVGLIAGAFICAIVYLALNPNKKIKQYGFIIFGILATLVFMMFIYSSKLPKSVERIFTLKDSNTLARLIQWKIALSGYKDRPLLGTGPENYYVIANQYYRPELAQYDRSWFDKPHNYILEILVTNGILGLISYLAILGFIITALYKGYKAEFYGLEEFCLLLGALFSYQVQNLTVFDTVPASLMFYGFMGFAGYVWTISQTSLVEVKAKEALPVFNIRPLAFSALGVTFLLMAYTIYATEIIPMQIAKNVNYGFAYASVDPAKAFEYFQVATSLPFNFDKTETASKFDEFAANYARSAGQKDQTRALAILDSASAFTQEALATQPDYPILWQRMSGLYLFRSVQIGGKVVVDPRAEEAAQKAISLAPKREEGYLALAQIRALQGDNKTAKDLLAQAMENFPADAGVKVQLANMYRLEGQTEKAVALMEQAVKQGYGFSSFGEIEWLSNYYVGLKEYDRAMDLLVLGQKLEPNNLLVFIDLAKLYAVSGKNDLAKNLAENIMKFDASRAKEMQALINSLPKSGQVAGTASGTPAGK